MNCDLAERRAVEDLDDTALGLVLRAGCGVHRDGREGRRGGAAGGIGEVAVQQVVPWKLVEPAMRLIVLRIEST